VQVLVLGSSGMLGHKLVQHLGDRHRVSATVRGNAASYASTVVFQRAELYGDVHAEDMPSVERIVSQAMPDAVVNCIGIVKQVAAAKDPIASIEINSLFPHKLARLCRARGIRLVHISTDCVFSGRRGMYSEADNPDAEDLYGRSKLLGEPVSSGCLTLRTSIIGRELRSSHGLLEWFLAQTGGAVHGYRKAVFSGLTTGALATIIGEVIANHADLDGLWHVASRPVTKYGLLCLIRDTYNLAVEILPDDALACDRSLDGSLFQSSTGLVVPSWPEMVQDMADDATPYDRLRMNAPAASPQEDGQESQR